MDAARDHVARHGAPTLQQQRRLVEPIEQRDGDLDDLAQIVVGHPERDSIADHVGPADQILDLVGTDAKTAGLDHRVVAADEPQVAIRIDPDDVAAIDDRRVTDQVAQFRARADLRTRRLGLVPVAHADQRPVMHQFALLARAGNAVAVADHMHFGVGHRAADRPHLLREPFGREIGGPERLGQSVHQVDIDPGKAVRHPFEDIARDPAAGIGDPAQRGHRHGLTIEQSHDLAPQGWDGCHAGHAVHLHRPDELGRHDRRRMDDGAADQHHRGQLVQTIIETVGQHAQQPVFLAKPQIADDGCRACQEIAMAEHHPLGQAGRSRGIEDHGQIPAGPGHFPGARAVVIGVRVRVDHDQVGHACGQWTVRQPPHHRRLHDHDMGAAIVDDVAQLIGGPLDVHVDDHRARLGHREHRDHLVRGLAQLHRHTVARPDAQRQQPARQRIHTRADRAIVDADVAIDDRRLVRAQRQVGGQQPVEGGGRGHVAWFANGPSRGTIRAGDP